MSTFDSDQRHWFWSGTNLIIVAAHIQRGLVKRLPVEEKPMHAAQLRRSVRHLISGAALLLLSTAATSAHEAYEGSCGCPCPYQAMGHHMMQHHAGNLMEQGQEGMMGPGMMEGRGREMMGKGMMSRGMGGGRMMNRFATVDVNQDGTISADEAAAQSESVFDQLDADGDEAVTQEEFMAWQMGLGAGRTEAQFDRRMERRQARFQEIDKNDDGRVTKEEFFAAAESQFQNSDSDKNGQVTPWEFRMARRF